MSTDVVLMFLLIILNIFKPFSSVSIVDFEEVDVSWVSAENTAKRTFIGLSSHKNNFKKNIEKHEKVPHSRGVL